MKNYFVIIISLLILTNCSSSKTITSASTDNHLLYKVKRIECGDICTIELVRNDSIFCVISLHKNLNTDQKEIKRGRSYPLHLLRIYPNEEVERNGKDDMDAYKDNGGWLDIGWIITKKYHYSLYVATNLSGLYITNNNKSEKEILENLATQEVMGYNSTVRLFVK